MDQLAELMGIRPYASKYLLNDPKLAYYLWFGPCLPYHYRLEGPHKWDGAREAILSVWHRVAAPTRTRFIKDDSKSNWTLIYILLIALGVFLLLFLFLG